MQLRCFRSPTHWKPRHSHFDGFVPVFRFDAPRTATLLPRNNPPKQAQEIGFEIKQMAGQTERHWTSMRKSCMLHSSLPTFFYFNYPTLHVYILKGSAPNLLWANGCLPKTWSSVLEHCIEEICPSEQIWLVGHVLIIFGRILHEKKLCKGNSKLHYINSPSKMPSPIATYVWFLKSPSFVSRPPNDQRRTPLAALSILTNLEMLRTRQHFWTAVFPMKIKQFLPILVHNYWDNSMIISKMNAKSLEEDVYKYTIKNSKLESSSGVPRSHIIHINLKGMKPSVEVGIFPKWSKYQKKWAMEIDEKL